MFDVLDATLLLKPLPVKGDVVTAIKKGCLVFVLIPYASPPVSADCPEVAFVLETIKDCCVCLPLSRTLLIVVLGPLMTNTCHK